ncbi:Acyl-CoA N-acyltransferase [Beauveria brongniartii RCEF 3172]|uniref:Acyl-CoA N-acyltransferase n=1 Tax=Beauveria brongniartii RCEF 3172 TaxID=1081107 RepID=A0A167DFY6_9HYPO|nr:Acyl-CoA N-acyltransferase [Beauveria brongniartii RCEF 3172]
MKVRAATDADVPAIAALILAAASAEAPWTSYLPARLRRDPVLVQHAELVLRDHLAAGNETSAVVVAELSADESDRSRPEIVAAAVWDTQTSWAQPTKTDVADCTTTTSPAGDDWCPHDAADDYRKLSALSDAMRQGRRQYFAAEQPHIYLRVLATHPDHQGRGHAKALCRWGVALARRKRVGVCLETGSRGYIALSGMGFEHLGAVVVPAGQGYDEQVLKALRMDAAAAQAASPSVWDSLWKYISS